MYGREVVAPPMSDRGKVVVTHGHEAALPTCGHKVVAPLMRGHSKVAAAAAYGHEVALPKYGYGDAVAGQSAAVAAFVRGSR